MVLAILTYLGSSFFGGIIVAYINHHSQAKRYKDQFRAENKNYIMRKKVELVYNVNKDLLDFNSVTIDNYIPMKKYIESPIENYEKEKEKLYEMLEKTKGSKIEQEEYLENLNINLVYFPEIKAKIQKTSLYLNQRMIIIGMAYEDEDKGVEKPYFEKRLLGERNTNFEKEFYKAYEDYERGFKEVQQCLNDEVEKVVKYFES